jgi:hypothetical protein
VERFRDPDSERDIFVIELAEVADWPTKTPWSCGSFGLLLVLDHVVDVAPLATRANAQGLAVASVWGPGCAIVEDAFDEAIGDRSLITSSHPDESLEEAMEFFLAVVPVHRGCDAWCIAAFGPKGRAAVEHALERRGAKRLTR